MSFGLVCGLVTHDRLNFRQHRSNRLAIDRPENAYRGSAVIAKIAVSNAQFNTASKQDMFVVHLGTFGKGIATMRFGIDGPAYVNT